MDSRKDRTAWARATDAVTAAVGSPAAFALLVAALISWGIFGAVHGFDELLLGILHATAATVAVLLLFVMQHTHNRQMRGVQMKLDELVRSLDGPRNELAGAEKETEETQRELRRGPRAR